MSRTLVRASRGGAVESVHRVSLAVVDAGGSLCAWSGDADLLTITRSAIKPFQALPLVEDGGLERFGLSDPELALVTASHNAEPFHVEATLAILAKIGETEEALACGPQRPMHAASALALDRAGRLPTRIHNNCSGKHAGMLALARLHGWPSEGYQHPDHPVQLRMRETFAGWAGVAPEEFSEGTDGCGIPTFGASLRVVAGAFARLAEAAHTAGSAAARVISAMTRHPEYVAGTGRACTDVMRAAHGRVFVKIGAEGVYGAGWPEAGLGLALKVEDGAMRASPPALVAVLRALAWPLEDAPALAVHAEPPVRNTRGEIVGKLTAEVRLERRG